MLDSARRGARVPALSRWLLELGIAATLAANVAHGLGHGPICRSRRVAVALAGSTPVFSRGPFAVARCGAGAPAESFCNTSRECGRRCPRCSEALPARICNKCNTLR